MFLQAFGVVAGRTLSRRIFRQAPEAAAAAAAAVVSRWKPAGTRLLHSQRNNFGDASAAAARRFGFSLRDNKSYTMAIAGCSTFAVGLWYMKNFCPSKIDWVEAGVVSPVVRKQNGCGSCLAMASVASVEALHHMETKQSITLSVQELIDCDTRNNGCEGGYHEHAFKYILENGLSSESSYPYKAQRSTSGCKQIKTKAARISDFHYVDPTEHALEKAVAKQPVVVILQGSDDLQRYKGGILDYPFDRSNNSWHAVLIVGYGTDSDGVKYWRFKNSWGEKWGEGGFGRIRRHVADKRGALGIYVLPGVYPVLTT